jgi:uncharacterized metal-binding protein
MLKNVKNEKSVSEIVREEIDCTPFLRTALEMNLLNYSALARFLTTKIQEKYGRRVNKESIVVAAIRYQKEMVKIKLSERLKRGISECNLSMRSDIIDLTLHKTYQIQEIVNDFSKKIDWKKGGIMFVVQGRAEVEIILDKISYNEIKEALPEETIINEVHGLSTISIHQPNSELTFVPGFYAILLNNLAMNDINILEIMSTLTEMIIVVSQKQASKSFEILNELIERFRK